MTQSQSSGLNRVLDPRTGILTSIDYVKPLPGGPYIHTFRGALPTPYSRIKGKLLREQTPRIIVSGSSFDRVAALWALIGEGFERYAAYSFDDEMTVEASQNDLGSAAIGPSEWIGFDREGGAPQPLFQEYDRGKPIRWARAHDVDGQPFYVPAPMVWLRLGQPMPAENFSQRASTGLGAGTTPHQAMLSGLLELIERDAFASRWLIRQAPPRLNSELVFSEHLLRLNGQTSGLRLDLFDLRVMDLVPVVLALFTLPNRDFGICLGASASLSPIVAVNKATVEAYHILQGMIHWQSKENRSITPDDIRDFVDHGRYYSRSSAASTAQWFFESSKIGSEVLPMDFRGDLAIRALVSGLKRFGLSTYFVDITPDDISELGFFVYRTLVPGLQPLSCGPQTIYDDRRRLASICSHNEMLLPHELNRSVHPFA